MPPSCAENCHELPTTVHVTTREDWRAWLEKNHAREKEVWLVYFKKDSGKPRVSYEDAVEEALCFGWVDSLVQRIDEECYRQKFTPRHPGSKWSFLNLKRVTKLTKEGRMTTARSKALASATRGMKGHRSASQRAKTRPFPTELAAALRLSPKAQAFFDTLAPSYRRMYVAWISDTKKEETRARRVHEAVERLSKGLKLGMK